MSEMTERLARMKAARAELEGSLADIKKAGNKGFIQLVQPIFAEFPGLQWFSWTQYTPYFNDGDPCVFRNGSDYVRASYAEPNAGTLGASGSDVAASSVSSDAVGETDDEDEDSDLDEVWTGADSELPWAVRIGEVLGALGDEGLLALFGDHVRVRAQRSGDTVTVSVDEYSHD